MSNLLYGRGPLGCVLCKCAGRLRRRCGARLHRSTSPETLWSGRRPRTWCPALKVWSRLQDMKLDRDHRVLAWRILHASILCGAFRMYLGRSPEQDAVCSFLCFSCVPQIHMFVTCPTARSAWLWVSDVWQQLTGHRPKPVGQRAAGRFGQSFQ